MEVDVATYDPFSASDPDTKGPNAVTKSPPWDDSPANAQQIAYAKELVRRLHTEANWSSLDATTLSLVLSKLNSLRKPLGIGFKEIDGMDTGRGRR